MTYEQFWNQDCDLVKYYRKAAQIKQDLKNQNAWLQGLYYLRKLWLMVAPIFMAFANSIKSLLILIVKSPFDLNMRKDEKSSGKEGKPE
jgi:hypothetical protein